MARLVAVALVGTNAAWLALVVLQRLLSGRFWLWLVPDLAPPLAYLVVPVLLAALSAPAAGWAGAGLAAAALVLGAGRAGVTLRLAPRRPVPGGAIRIVSWNTRYWDQGADPACLYALLRDLEADVYVLQEYVHGPHHALSQVDDLDGLRRELPGYQAVARGELITLTRLPVATAAGVGPARELCPGAGWRRQYDMTKVLRTDLRVGAATLSVYNVHIPAQCAPGDNPCARRFYRDLRERARLRAAQFAGLVADLQANAHPAVVTGDFNSTGAMGEMRRLARLLVSANRASSRRRLASWPAGGAPLWQLDWTFTTGVRVHRFELRDPRGLSDHRLQELVLSIAHT